MDNRPNLIALAVLLINVLVCARLIAAEGDPPLEVPTLEQGRALLARDAHRRQCEAAATNDRWLVVLENAKAALEQEEVVFGTDFEGTETTNFYIQLALQQLGRDEDYLREMRRQFNTFIRESEKILPGLTPPISKSEFEYIVTLNSRLQDVVSKSTVADDEKDLKASFQRSLDLALWLESKHSEVDAFDKRLRNWQKKAEKLLEEASAAQKITESQADDVRFNIEAYVVSNRGESTAYLYATSAAHETGYIELALKYARRAFEIRARDHIHLWHEDFEPDYGGREVAFRYYRLLRDSANAARQEGNWSRVIELHNQCTPLITHLEIEDAAYDQAMLVDEAKALLQLTPEEQSRYLELLSLGSEITEDPSDESIRRLKRLASERQVILGDKNDLIAEDQNRVAVFYSNRDDHLQTIDWSRKSLHRYLRSRSADSPMLLRVANNYLGTLVQNVRNAEIELTKDLVADLKVTTLQVRKQFRETPIAGQFTVALSEMQARLGFGAEMQDLLARYQKVAFKRDGNFSNGRFDLAVPLAQDCVELTEQIWGPDSWRYADDRRALANCLTNIGRHNEALAILEQTKAAFDRFPFNQTSDFGWFLHGYAFALRNQGEQGSARMAIDLLEQARELELKITGKLGAYADHTSLLAETLNDLVGDTKSAIELYQEVAQIYHDMGDQGQWGYCQALVNVGRCQTRLGLYDAAEQQLSEALSIRQRLHFQNPHMEAWNHWARGDNAFFMHQFERSIEYITTAVELKERYTPAANDIDSLYGQIIRAAAWENDGSHHRHIENFFKSAEKRYGVGSLGFANACRAVSFELAKSPDPDTFLTTEAQFTALHRITSRAIEVYRGLDAEYSKEAIYALKGLADSLRNEPIKSIQTYHKVIQLAEKHNPVLWDAIGLAHVGISNVERDINGAIHESLRHRRLAVQPLIKAFGDSSSEVANIMVGQADVLVALGDFDSAEKLLADALEITLVYDRNPLAIYLELSTLHRLRGNLDRAEQYLYIARNKLGQRKFSDAFDRRIRLSLGSIATDRGEFMSARQIARDLLEEVKGEGREEKKMRFGAKALLGRSQLGLRRYKEAYHLLAEVVQEASESTPEEPLHLNSDTRRAFALSCLHLGDSDRSHELLLTQLRDTIKRHRESATELTPRQQLGLRRDIDDSLSAYLSFAIENKRPAKAIYQNIFDIKGIVSSYQRRFSLDDYDTPEWQDAVLELTKVNRELSSALFVTSGGSTRKETVAAIQRLTAQRENLQLRLAKFDLKKNDGKLKQSFNQPTLESLQHTLGDAHLIDFVIYSHSQDLASVSPEADRSEPEVDRTEKDKPSCLAFIVACDGIEMVDLADLASLQEVVLDWRKNLDNNQALTQATQSLRQRLWEPLEQHIPEQGTLLLATDGPLQQLAFSAISDGKNGYLIDHYTMTLIPSPRFLLQRRTARPTQVENSKDQILLVGDVNYFRPDQGTVSPERISPTQALAMASMPSPRRAERSGTGMGNAWRQLKGTADEIDAIASTLDELESHATVRSLTGHDANEASVGLLAQESRILHLATHGFFAQASKDSAWQLQSLSRRAVSGFDPQLLTGIVLAGANGAPEDGQNDGILTAAEIETLDLNGNELTVLSACETALGETASGEGVLGLQRALHLAGSRNVVASLWKVDDNATMILMTLFYKNLLEKKMSKADALREAQLWMLDHPRDVNDPDTAAQLKSRGTRGYDLKKQPKSGSGRSRRLSPRFWAAFSLSGDWN